MIPIRDDNPTLRRAIVVPLLIGANAFVFLFVQPTFANQRTVEGQVDTFSFFACRAAIPYEVTHGRSLGDLSRDAFTNRRALATSLVQRERCPEKSIALSVLISMFLHGSWLHIGGNMLFLWVFGNNVEDRLGRLRFIAFYLLCGVAATFAQVYVSPSSTVPLIGASGAIAGVLGAYLVMFPAARITTLVPFFLFWLTELPAFVVLGVWFLMQFLQTVGNVTADAGGVAYMAHVGGFVTGIVLLLILRPRRRPVARTSAPY